MTDKHKTSIGAVVAGVAGLTAAAVGAYFLYGSKDAKKNRHAVKGWMLKAKGEVLEELEKVGGVSESTYKGAVDAVVKKYNELKTIDPLELQAFLRDMKDHWDAISTPTKPRGKGVSKKSKGKKK